MSSPQKVPATNAGHHHVEEQRQRLDLLGLLAGQCQNSLTRRAGMTHRGIQEGHHRQGCSDQTCRHNQCRGYGDAAGTQRLKTQASSTNNT